MQIGRLLSLAKLTVGAASTLAVSSETHADRKP